VDPADTPSRPAWTRREALLLAAILLYAIGVRCLLMDLPFGRNAEGMGAFYGVLARNYLRFDWDKTLAVPVQSMGDRTDLPITFYAHHPPMVPLLIAGSYRLFGQDEWQTRLPTALFTIGCVALVHLLLRNRGHVRAGLVAAGIFAALPMTIYFGGQPDCINTQLAFLMLLTLAAYQHLHAQPSVRRIILLCLAFLPAALTDWPAFYIVPVIAGHYALTRPWRRWVWMVPFGLFSIAAFVLVYGQAAVVLHDWLWMSDKLARRALSTQSDRNTTYSWIEWLGGIWRHNHKHHTIPILALGGLWLVLIGRKIRSGDAATTITRLALAVALLHVLIGRQGVLVHDWWWWVLTPGLAMAAGLMVEWLLDGVPVGSPRLATSILTPLLMVSFAGWSLWTVWPDMFGPLPTQGGLNYSTRELGQAIRVAGPDVNSAVVYCYEQSYDLPVWYYADRPLKLDVWDMATLEWRMTDGVADLSFGFTQPWPDPPTGLVLPRQFIPAVPEFTEQLKARYPFRELDKFLVFDLRSPIAP
jgi:hypothetical protein